MARAVLIAEPDRIGRLRPRARGADAALRRRGVGPPAARRPLRRTARIALPPGGSPAAAARALRQALPDAGLDIRDRYDAAPGARRLIDRLEYFLGFIGLAVAARRRPGRVRRGLGLSGDAQALDRRAQGPGRRGAADPRRLSDPDRASWPRSGSASALASGAAAPLAIGWIGAGPAADPGPVRGLSPAPGQGRRCSAFCPPRPSRWSRWPGPGPPRRRRCSAATWPGGAGLGPRDRSARCSPASGWRAWPSSPRRRR